METKEDIICLKNHTENYSEPIVMINATNYKKLINDHNHLIDENNNLRLKLLDLSLNEKRMQELTNNNSLLVQELQKENELIKCILNSLQSDFKDLHENNIGLNDKTKLHDTKILEQTNETHTQNTQIINQINEIKNLQKEIQNVNARVDDEKYAKLYQKYIVTIQELALSSRDEKIDEETYNNLERLLKYQTNDHYFDESDTEEINNVKRAVLYDKLQNMPAKIKELFDRKFNNVVESIVPYVLRSQIDLSLNISMEALEDIHDWWD
jgi:hypothetical protein